MAGSLGRGSKVSGVGFTLEKSMPPEDQVTDDEQLYRRIPNSREFFSVVDGEPRFSSSAFNDRKHKPSVNRSKIRPDPCETKADPADGITSLIAVEVRAITTIKNEGALPNDPELYGIDVIPRPIPADNPDGLPENLAHAQIESNPEFKTSSRFKKLKEALALLANKRGWVIDPS